MSSSLKIKEALLELLNEANEPEHPPVYPIQADAIEPWVKSMETGTFSGRVFSPHTIKHYRYYVDYFIKTYRVITYTNLEIELSNTPVDMFGRKDKFYRAIVCFAKYLNRNYSLDSPDFFEKIKHLKPKRNKPPNRITLNEAQLKDVFEAADDAQNLLALKLIASTGLRASECCALRIEDIDFEEHVLTVQCGKGGKRRRVGLNDEVLRLLKQHLKRHPTSSTHNLFYDRFGNAMRRDGLLNRLRRIGDRAGVHTTPHALRRAFVTINANKGRSLVMLQIACGHSDIKTTRSYCQTTENEVIEAMRNW